MLGCMGMLVVFEFIFCNCEECWIGGCIVGFGWVGGIIIFWGYCFLYNFCSFFLIWWFFLFFNIWSVWFISLCFFFVLDCFVNISSDCNFEMWKFNSICCVWKKKFKLIIGIIIIKKNMLNNRKFVVFFICRFVILFILFFFNWYFF